MTDIDDDIHDELDDDRGPSRGQARDGSNDERVAGATLEERATSLESRVAALEQRLVGGTPASPVVGGTVAEVRTRRLVVEDAAGAERLVASGGDDHGFLVLRGRADGPPGAEVGLFAHDPVDGEGTHVGVALAGAGELLAVFEVDDRRGPSLWLRPGRARPRPRRAGRWRRPWR